MRNFEEIISKMNLPESEKKRILKTVENSKEKRIELISELKKEEEEFQKNIRNKVLEEIKNLIAILNGIKKSFNLKEHQKILFQDMILKLESIEFESKREDLDLILNFIFEKIDGIRIFDIYLNSAIFPVFKNLDILITKNVYGWK